jgi:hypothetical protein
LPDYVQAQLGVKPGDELALEEENGKWVIKPARLSATNPHQSLSSQAFSDEGPLPAQRPTANSPADNDADDLNWEELDYDPVPLKRARQVTVHIEHRGRLQPPAHDLDEE